MELTPEEMAIREEVVDRVRQMLRNSNLERFDPDVSDRERERPEMVAGNAATILQL